MASACASLPARYHHRHHHYHHRHRHNTTLWSHSVPDRIIYIELVRLRLKVFPELDAMNHTWRVHHMPNGSFLTLKLWQFICGNNDFWESTATMTTRVRKNRGIKWIDQHWFFNTGKRENRKRLTVRLNEYFVEISKGYSLQTARINNKIFNCIKM